MNVLPTAKRREISKVEVFPFYHNGNPGTEIRYLLNGHPALARAWHVMGNEEARMWLINQK